MEETKTRQKGILGSRIGMSTKAQKSGGTGALEEPATWWCCGAELGARQEQTSKAKRNVGLKGFMQFLKAPGAPERKRSLAFWQVPSGTRVRVKAKVSCRTP